MPCYISPYDILFIADSIATIKKIIVLYIKGDTSSDSSEKNIILKIIAIEHIPTIKAFQFIFYLTSYNIANTKP